MRKGLRDAHREKVEEAAKDPQGIYKLHIWAKRRGLQRHSFTPATKSEQGKRVKEPEENIGLLIDRFFPNPSEAVTVEEQEAPAGNPTPIRWRPFTKTGLRRAIERSNPDKAPGPDGIPNRVIQKLADELMPVLLPVSNECIRIGYQPQSWRTSNTVALKKPGKTDYSIPKAWKPIALINTLGKVLDSMLAVRLSYWADEEGILPNAHMGGRKGIGVDHAIQLLLERIAGVVGSRTH